MTNYSFTILRGSGIRMRYEGHFIIQHSQNTNPANSVAGFEQEPGGPLFAVSLLLSNSFFSASMAFWLGLYRHMLVWHAHDRISIVFLHFLLAGDLFKTVLMWSGMFFENEREKNPVSKKYPCKV